MGHTPVDSGLDLICSLLASALQNKGRGQRKPNFRKIGKGKKVENGEQEIIKKYNKQET